MIKTTTTFTKTPVETEPRLFERDRERIEYLFCIHYVIVTDWTKLLLDWMVCQREYTPKKILIETVNKFKHIGCSPKKLGYAPKKTVGCFFSKWHLKLKLDITGVDHQVVEKGFHCYFRWPPCIRGPQSHKTIVNTSNCHTWVALFDPSEMGGIYRPPKKSLPEVQVDDWIWMSLP